MIDWFGPILWEYFAATEGAGASIGPQEWLARPGSVGRPPTADHVEILDETATSARRAGAGTIHVKRVRGRRLRVLQRSGQDGRRPPGDYFSIGDIGFLDDDGYLFVTDRDADVIISGGVNIYPAEVEAVLLTHPDIADAAVIGVADEEFGEQVLALVELPATDRDPAAIAGDIIAYCRDRLAHFKCPRRVEIVDDLPRGHNGKLSRNELRRRYRDQTASTGGQPGYGPDHRTGDHRTRDHRRRQGRRMTDSLHHFIDGAWVPPPAGTSADVIDPSTETAVGRVAWRARGCRPCRRRGVSSRTRVGVDHDRRARRPAGSDRRPLPGSARGARGGHLERDGLADRAGQIGASDVGPRPPRGHGRGGTRDSRSTSGGAATLIVREPIGVCGLITPWNWPAEPDHVQGGTGAGRRLHHGAEAQRVRSPVGRRDCRDARRLPACRPGSSTSSSATDRASARTSPRTPASTWCRSPGRPAQASPLRMQPLSR